MKILRHRLHHDDSTPLPYVPSPNRGADLEAEWLVIHYTAGSSAESSVAWFANPAARASAHVVIGMDGQVTQVVPFDRIAFHAGKSRWAERVGLNANSLGIELDNPGKLAPVGSRFRAWFGREYDESQVLVASHRNESDIAGWHVFPEEQIEAALEVATLLVERYDLKGIVGHDDIAPGRKVDPGPAFPMRSFRARVMGRSEDEDGVFYTTTHLNIRSGPGVDHATLPGSPLRPGTAVWVLESQGRWRLVQVSAGDDALEGWVHGSFLL